MKEFLLQKGYDEELQQFAHITEFAVKKNSSVQLNSLNEDCTNNIRIYYIIDGKYEWNIRDKEYILYPGDLIIIQPGHKFGGQKGVMDRGTLCWIYVELEKASIPENILFGNWSCLPKKELSAIGKILKLSSSPVISKVKEVERILFAIRHELFHQQIAYITRVNQLIDEMFILIARKLSLQNNTQRDFPKSFLTLEEELRKNLSNQWTVEDMAALVGLGTTAFTEKVKNYSGFSPLNYLITIRISEAMRLLRRNDLNITDIALDTGFYSSQHFSTTFKKLTGYTPSNFRKKNISNEKD
ncbi:AraC family transcriptional regulator [Ferruginibacter sp. HRS2-29]|uniref:AraC family transcriptional regulator n=1 Tax=Ferruginibacter sp. HRS2-29 TaxID=2487334 RepID=UPI0020CF4654|nr:AraC family transcriptional regulator [Ferruginibacter sp. HRS2-29]MCP9753448.1 AraC family transcriptional regulator [Ferruginibacter sp. HRS2-29]